jgi:hypothetical protein
MKKKMEPGIWMTEDGWRAEKSVNFRNRIVVAIKRNTRIYVHIYMHTYIQSTVVIGKDPDLYSEVLVSHLGMNTVNPDWREAFHGILSRRTPW